MKDSGLLGCNGTHQSFSLLGAHICTHCAPARVYPKRFCSALYRAFFHTELRHHRRDLRNKNVVEPGLSDRELFERMPLGDVWSDANIADVYFYARSNPHLEIPDTWRSTIAIFDQELDTRVPVLHYCMTSTIACLVHDRLCAPAQVNACPELREEYMDLLRGSAVSP